MITSNFKELNQIQEVAVTQKTIKFSHSLFNLFSAVYKQGKNFIDVYIIELKFLKLVEIYELVNRINSNDKAFSDNKKISTLHRLGFYVNEEDNMNLVYLKDKNEHFDINNLIKDRKFELEIDESLVKLDIIRQMIAFMLDLHEKKIYLHFFHPMLIFYNNTTGFRYFDYVIGVIIQKAFSNNNIPDTFLSNYEINFFGVFDKNINMKNYYFIQFADKKDVILVLIFIVYIFSNVTKDNKHNDSFSENSDHSIVHDNMFLRKREKNSNVNNQNLFELIITLFMKDYVNNYFNSIFKYLKEEKIKKFVLQHLKFKYTEIDTLDILYQDFSLLYYTEIKKYLFKNQQFICPNCDICEIDYISEYSDEEKQDENVEKELEIKDNEDHIEQVYTEKENNYSIEEIKDNLEPDISIQHKDISEPNLSNIHKDNLESNISCIGKDQKDDESDFDEEINDERIAYKTNNINYKENESIKDRSIRKSYIAEVNNLPYDHSHIKNNSNNNSYIEDNKLPNDHSHIKNNSNNNRYIEQNTNPNINQDISYQKDENSKLTENKEHIEKINQSEIIIKNKNKYVLNNSENIFKLNQSELNKRNNNYNLKNENINYIDSNKSRITKISQNVQDKESLEKYILIYDEHNRSIIDSSKNKNLIEKIEINNPPQTLFNPIFKEEFEGINNYEENIVQPKSEITNKHQDFKNEDQKDNHNETILITNINKSHISVKPIENQEKINIVINNEDIKHNNNQLILVKSEKEVKLNYTIHKHCFELVCSKCKDIHKCNYIKKDLKEKNISGLISSRQFKIVDLSNQWTMLNNIRKKEFIETYNKGYKIKQENIVTLHFEKEILFSKHEKYLNKIIEEVEKESIHLFDLERRKNRIKENEILKMNSHNKEFQHKFLDALNSILRLNDIAENLQAKKRYFNNIQSLQIYFYNLKQIVLKYINLLKNHRRQFLIDTNFVRNYLIDFLIERENKYKSKDPSIIINPIYKEINIYEINNNGETKFKNHENIAFINSSSKVYYCYNVNSKRNKIIQPNEQSEVKNNCKILNLHYGFIVSGGFKGNSASKNVQYVLYPEDDDRKKVPINFKNLPNLNNRREQHSMVIVNDIHLVVIGGKDTKTCETINLLFYNEENNWTNLPELEYYIINSAVAVFNNLDIYLFFGQKIENNIPESSDMIFKLNFFSDKWEQINYNHSDIVGKSIDNDFRMYNVGILKYSHNEIIIIGGRQNNSTYKYNFEKNKISIDKLEFLGKPTVFTFDNNFYSVSEHLFYAYSRDSYLVKLNY